MTRLRPAGGLVLLKVKKLDLELISGIELNTEMEDEEIHILGYFIDFEYLPLIEALEEIKAARFARAEAW